MRRSNVRVAEQHPQCATWEGREQPAPCLLMETLQSWSASWPILLKNSKGDGRQEAVNKSTVRLRIGATQTRRTSGLHPKRNSLVETALAMLEDLVFRLALRAVGGAFGLAQHPQKIASPDLLNVIR